MLAIHDQHDQFTHQMRNRLKTTGMGLGLVQLLLDARRTEEARATLSSLEHGFQGIAQGSEKPSQKPCQVNRLKSVQFFVHAPECEARICAMTKRSNAQRPTFAAKRTMKPANPVTPVVKSLPPFSRMSGSPATALNVP